MVVQAYNSHIQEATPEELWVDGQPGLPSMTLFYFILFFQTENFNKCHLNMEKRERLIKDEYSIWGPNRLNLLEIYQVYFSPLLETEMNTNLFFWLLVF